MIPDVVELDELETGQRREGVFYGFFVFVQKLGLAVGLGVSGLVLQVTGYQNATSAIPNPAQPASALLALRVLIGPGSAACLLLSFRRGISLSHHPREARPDARRNWDKRAKEKKA